jgi:hypothetical protein
MPTRFELLICRADKRTASSRFGSLARSLPSYDKRIDIALWTEQQAPPPHFFMLVEAIRFVLSSTFEDSLCFPLSWNESSKLLRVAFVMMYGPSRYGDYDSSDAVRNTGLRKKMRPSS